MLIQWTDDLSVGVKEIDEQHKIFLNILNDLCNTSCSAHPSSEIASILKQLTAYVSFHFATEEKYFDKFNYEFSAEHKEEHQKLLTRVAEFNQRFATEGDAILSELLDFLEDWLIDHLSGQDKKYTKCFNEHGLA
ncbi:MAG: bacteriohemerythrin [Patescibacteria group bacterium]